MATNPPSKGTKVTPPNPPLNHESAGPVVPDSLAAESAKANGEFAANHNIHAASPTSSNNNNNNNNNNNDNLASTKPHATPADVAAAATENTGADKAPTYINAVLGKGHADGKPHGTNVTEDDEMTGRPGKFEVDEKEVSARATGAVSGGGAPGGGDGARGGAFDALGREAEA
ncbi:unnamed protein product [Discula destructiva]